MCPDPSRVVERRRETVDVVLGVLGFFTVMLLASTVLAEVRGDDSLARALALAVFVVLLYVLVRISPGAGRAAVGRPRESGAA